MSKKKKPLEKKDMLDYFLERSVKIDLLVDLYFEMNELVRPAKDSGEVWIDSKVQESRIVEDYYYHNTLILTIVNDGLNYKITKGF